MVHIVRPRWVYFFQINPEGSLRRVPALGGPSEAVLPFGVIDTFFDVSVTGQITWAEYFEGDCEIWSAQVR